jgi:hypothetical protein
MEVSGYPHYENVASNLLAFFFHPGEEHGLGDLMLRAFVSAAGLQQFEGARTAAVRREHITGKGGRLDLLITAGNYVVGIENKIFHPAPNDFADYAGEIERRGTKESVRVKAVLSLEPIRGHGQMAAAGFVSITYGQLWEQVRAHIGHYVQGAHPKWLGFLFDFMETTTRLAGEHNGLTPTDEFLISHHNVIERLLADRQNLLGRLSRNVNRLKDMMDDAPSPPGHLVRRWVYASVCLVHDFVNQDYKVALDLNVSLEGWALTFFKRPGTPLSYVQSLNNSPALSIRMRDRPMVGDRYLAATWTLQTPLEELQREMDSWVRAVNDAMVTS